MAVFNQSMSVYIHIYISVIKLDLSSILYTIIPGVGIGRRVFFCDCIFLATCSFGLQKCAPFPVLCRAVDLILLSK